MQEVWPYGFDKLARCRIYIRFMTNEEGAVLAYLKQGCVYLFMSELVVSDNVQLIFRIQNYRKNIFCLLPY